jgi:hypothetical protein
MATVTCSVHDLTGLTPRQLRQRIRAGQWRGPSGPGRSAGVLGLWCYTTGSDHAGETWASPDARPGAHVHQRST